MYFIELDNDGVNETAEGAVGMYEKSFNTWEL